MQVLLIQGLLVKWSRRCPLTAEYRGSTPLQTVFEFLGTKNSFLCHKKDRRYSPAIWFRIIYIVCVGVLSATAYSLTMERYSSSRIFSKPAIISANVKQAILTPSLSRSSPPPEEAQTAIHSSPEQFWHGVPGPQTSTNKSETPLIHFWLLIIVICTRDKALYLYNLL